MPSSTLLHESPRVRDRRREVALWTGVLAGPLVWLTLLEFNYVLSYVACETRQTWFLHVASIVSLILVAAAGVIGWRARTRARREPTDSERPRDPLSPEVAETRAIWMGYVAAATSAFFILVIVATDLPVLVVPPCV